MDNLDQQITSLKLRSAESLDTEQKLRVCANLLGYRSMPVSIDTFLDDPYYMGSSTENFFPFWRTKLREIFPTPIHTAKPFIVFTGGIGTGKSTAAVFIAEYMKYRISLLKDPYKTLEIIGGKPLKFSFFHKTAELASTDFLERMDKFEGMSPYFKESYETGRMDIFNCVADSVRSNNNIGSDVIFYNLSELNFINKDSAFDKLNQAFKRFNSRFEAIRNYFGCIIIDTSSQGDDSIADDFIDSNPYGDDVISIHTNRWLVREHLHRYGRKGWFKVFCGDGTHQPFIVKPEAGKIVTPDMDPDRLIDVPEECRADFEFDLVSALQDIAGISVSASDRFFPDTTNLKKCFDLPQYGPDVVKFDFYDKSDKLIYRFSKSIDTIPLDKIIYIRYDIGVVGDNTGLAIAYFDKWFTYDKDKDVRQPIINIPLAVGINRFEGTETPIYQLFEFLMDLKDRFEIGCFTADQFASRQLLQDCTREGIKNQYLSVDRTDEAYVYTKSLANNRLLHIANNQLAKQEMCDLRRVGGKVDHTAAGCFIGLTEIICKSIDGVICELTLESLLENYQYYRILSYNNDKSTYEWNPIQNVIHTKDVNQLIKLEFDDGNIYYCTPDHQILTNRGYIKAEDLTLTDEIINIFSSCRIDS